MAGFPGWQTSLLTALHAPSTPGNLKFLNAWQLGEGGTAAYNPFNTTLSMPGATSYNGVGVRNYTTPEQGVQATVRTLQGNFKNYPQIIQGLRAGADPHSLANLVGGSPWGTHHISIDGQPIAPVVSPSPVGRANSGPADLRAFSGNGGVGGTVTPSRPPAPDNFLSNLFAQGDQMFGLPKSDPGMFNLQAPQAPKTAPTLQVHIDHASVPSPLTKGVIQLAMQYRGTPYVWGGSSPSGFDCSGFVQWLYAQRGIQVPRTTYEQIHVGQAVDKNSLQPGDIVFFDTESQAGPDHEGLYIGDGQFIHSPHTGDHVRISSLNDTYYSDHFFGARRVA